MKCLIIAWRCSIPVLSPQEINDSAHFLLLTGSRWFPDCINYRWKHHIRVRQCVFTHWPFTGKGESDNSKKRLLSMFFQHFPLVCDLLFLFLLEQYLQSYFLSRDAISLVEKIVFIGCQQFVKWQMFERRPIISLSGNII